MGLQGLSWKKYIMKLNRPVIVIYYTSPKPDLWNALTVSLVFGKERSFENFWLVRMKYSLNFKYLHIRSERSEPVKNWSTCFTSDTFSVISKLNNWFLDQKNTLYYLPQICASLWSTPVNCIKSWQINFFQLNFQTGWENF